jgi:hypothetical protein
MRRRMCKVSEVLVLTHPPALARAMALSTADGVNSSNTKPFTNTASHLASALAAASSTPFTSA